MGGWCTPVPRVVAVLPQGVLDEVVGAVTQRQAVTTVPTAPKMAPDRRGTVGGGTSRTVPQVGMVEQDVPVLLVDGDLAGYPLETGGNPVGPAGIRWPGRSDRSAR